MKPKIKPETLAGGGDSDGGNRGNSIPPIAMPADRRLPNRCPSLAEIRDEEEPAFIEEYQMGPQSSGFFLSGATGTSSSERWLLRPSAWPDVPASGNSTLTLPSDTRHWRDCSAPQTGPGLTWRCAAESRDQWSSQPLRVPEPEAAATCLGPLGITAGAVPASAWPPGLGSPAADRLVASALPSSRKRRPSRRSSGMSSPIAVIPQHGDVAFRAFPVFHAVSCLIG